MIQLKKTFNDILDNLYPEDEKLEKYKKVYVETIDEIRKSFHGDYNYAKKKIRIFNLYRSDAALVATSIHELAHHVDYCNRNTSDHGKEFYAVYKELLYTALNMGIFTKEEFLESTKDASDTQKVRAMLADYKPQTTDYKKDTVILSVKNGYEHREYLKKNGYTWNNTLKSWDKEFLSQEAENEKNRITSMKMDVEIRDAKKFVMSRGNLIIAGKGSYNVKDSLKKKGFSYSQKKKYWVKQGSKEEYESYRNTYPSIEWKFV